MQQEYAELTKYYRVKYFYEGNKDDEMSQSLSERINYLQYVTNAQSILKRSHINLDAFKARIYHIANNASPTTLLVALAVSDIVLLHDIDLKNLWDSALNKGIIDQSRYDLELTLDKKYGVSGASFLVSLLAAQRIVVVYSEQAKDIVGKVLENIAVIAEPGSMY